MVKPHHVVDDVRRRHGRSGDPRDPIRFYWVALTPEDDGGDRNRFRQLLRDVAGDYPLVPVVLRVPGFEDPNAVMNDLAEVPERCKRDLEAPEIRERIARHGFVDFVFSLKGAGGPGPSEESAGLQAECEERNRGGPTLEPDRSNSRRRVGEGGAQLGQGASVQ